MARRQQRVAPASPSDGSDGRRATGVRAEPLLRAVRLGSRGARLLLERLTSGWERGDGRTLFVVGDPMQSIYRFRQAEVGLFLRTRDHGLNSIRPGVLQLTRNF